MEKEVSLIKELYKNIETFVKIDGERLKKLEVKVGAHQSSVFSLLLFAVVMEEVTKDVREGGVKELLNANDLVFFGGSWEKIEKRYA